MRTIEPPDPALLDEDSVESETVQIALTKELGARHSKRTSKEIEANWIEFLRATQLSQRKSDDLFLHTCQECGEEVEISGSGIRMAKNNNAMLQLPCGHTTVVDVTAP